MKKKRILLTGDDGFASIGTRLLIHYLKKDYDLSIAGTQGQMSGVGGHGSFYGTGTWEEVSVDGITGFSVSGYPLDAIECAQGYFKEKFDLVISGINWGLNISGAIVASGTFAAALRALFIQLAPHAIAISWQTPPNVWFQKHIGNEELNDLLDYPGQTAVDIIRLAIKEKNWGATFLNINLPMKKSTEIRFTDFYPDLTQVLTYPVDMNKKHHTFTYPLTEKKSLSSDETYDAVAIDRGFITVTPCQTSPIDSKRFASLVKTPIPLYTESRH